MTRLFALALSAGVLAAPPVLAQASFTKIDVEPVLIGRSSAPAGMQIRENLPGTRQLVAAAGGWFFTSFVPGIGRELYFTNGTAAGTTLMKDIEVGQFDSFIHEGVELGGKLIFEALDSVHGTELWISDGTPAGTQLLFEFAPGQGAGSPAQLTRVGSRVFFRATVWQTGTELYVTDGTALGTQLVSDILPGNGSSVPDSLISNAAGTRLLFEATDGVHGRELWSSDGTAGGTQMVIDLEVGAAGAGFEQPTPLGSLIVFSGARAAEGQEVFVTDGTSAGTQLLGDLEPGPLGSDLVLTADGVASGKLYFSATTSASGVELFATDGTPAGTGLVLDAVPGAVGSFPMPLAESPAGLLLGMQLDPVNIGIELYLLSGSSVSLVKDLAPGSISLGPPMVADSSRPKEGLAQGGLVYFNAKGGLWASDGTAAGTQLVASMPETQQRLTPMGPNALMFVGGDTPHGIELFMTDGTSAGTQLLADVDPGQDAFGSSPLALTAVGGDDLYFDALNFAEGPSAFHWSATSGANPISLGMSPYWFPVGNSKFALMAPAWLGDHADNVFTVNEGVLNPVLYHTDGTTAGSSQFIDLGGRWVQILGANQQYLFLSVLDPVIGRELWVTDGTQAGTQLVMEINPGPAGANITASGVVGGKLYFRGDDGVHKAELWVSDGTAGGTYMVADINPTGGSLPEGFVGLGDLVLFAAFDGVNGLEPWVTDGTAAGTMMLADVNPGPGTSKPVSFNAGEGVAYFFADAGADYGRELWQTDGTPAGTKEAAPILNANKLSVPSVLVDGTLYFEAQRSGFGTELWSFDGTKASMVIDLWPGLQSGMAQSLVAVGHSLYFLGTTPQTGMELFRSDGTAAGTQLVGELIPGPDSGILDQLTLVAGGLMFRGEGADGDVELYRYDLPEGHSIDLGFGGDTAKLSVSAPVVGQSLVASVSGAPAGSVGLLLASGPAAPSATFMAYENASWLDLVGLSVLGSSTAPSWSLATAIPPGPAFVGIEANLQAWFLPVGTLPISSSNGQRIVIGN